MRRPSLTIAVYPGSFDPATNGHVDIARPAAAIFEHLFVAVYDAPPKNVLFSTEERVTLLQKALKDTPNITVASFGGLLGDYTKAKGAKVNGLVPGHVAEAMKRKFSSRPDVGAIPRYLTS